MQENMDLMKSFHTAAALLPEFDWDKVSCEDIRIPEGLFC